MLLAILLPMAAGGVLLVWRPQDPRRRQDFVVGSSCAGAAAALAAVFTLRGEEAFQLLSLGERLSIAFRVDGLSCVFAVLVSVLWPLACLYAAEYMSREGGENRFFAFYLASLGVTLGIAFSANVLTMYFFYELLTLSTLPLVMHALDSKARVCRADLSDLLHVRRGPGLYRHGAAAGARRDVLPVRWEHLS